MTRSVDIYTRLRRQRQWTNQTKYKVFAFIPFKIKTMHGIL